MARIRIVAVPPGFAPLSIREQWVGIEIPLATNRDISKNPPSELGIGSANRGGYMVLTSKAIEALKSAERISAAAFWKQLTLGHYLVFKRDVCELIPEP